MSRQGGGIFAAEPMVGLEVGLWPAELPGASHRSKCAPGPTDLASCSNLRLHFVGLQTQGVEADRLKARFLGILDELHAERERAAILQASHVGG